MRFWKRNSGAAKITALVLVCSCALAGPNNSKPDKAKLAEKSFAQLSDKTLSERARLALETDKTKWRHGETEHFVYHFQRITEAQKLAREAEFYYDKIREDIGGGDDLLEGKSHVIMFAKPGEWKNFTLAANVPEWSVGFAAGREMFMLVEAGDSDASDRLAHEMTHLVFFRFVPKPVPLWLHEGLAEYESKAAYAEFKGIGLKPTTGQRPPPMDLDRLTSLTQYPEQPFEVVQFYRQSERLVRFLISKHRKGQFVPFVNLLADGATFEQALLKTYSDKYRKIGDFQKQFDRFQ